MKDKVYKYYTELPDWAKGAVILGGGVVIFLLGRQVYRAVFPSSEQKRKQQLDKDIKKDIEEYQRQGLKQSFPDSQMILFANTIHNGMKYCAGDDYGTVEATLKKMQNNLDVALLAKAFGTRSDYCFGLPTGEFDLFTYVQKELGNDYAGLTNYRVVRINNDWRNKGIKYQL